MFDYYFLLDDDPCTSLEGRCQPNNVHCAGQFRLGLCSGTVNTCCVPQGTVFILEQIFFFLLKEIRSSRFNIRFQSVPRIDC